MHRIGVLIAELLEDELNAGVVLDGDKLTDLALEAVGSGSVCQI